ncbi:ABC-F family ATP-binding cassette domain-containing protein [Geodermatophilus sp. SYSU D00758]
MSATLVARGLAAGHGARVLFSDLDLVVAPGDVVGLVGVNGAGKSTLLRTLAGELPVQSGTVAVTPPTATLGYLPQEAERRPGESVRAALARRTGVTAAQAALDAATEALAAGRPGADDEYTAALERWLALGGADLDERIAQVVAEVAPGVDPAAGTAGLSGGQAARVGLAALLLSRYDVLLLDEPTNDLDLAGLAQLERFVTGSRAGIVVVSHDREFLARTVTRVVELDLPQQLVRVHDGGYEAYLTEREVARRHAREEYEQYAETRADLEARARMQRNWMAKGVRDAVKKQRDPDKFIKAHNRSSAEKQAAKARQTERRIERLEVVEEPRKEWELRMQIAAAPRAGAVVATLSGAVVRRGGFTLGPVDLQVDWGDRVAITGPNGAGKTTLLAALLGRVPLDAGRGSLGPSVRVGEIDQARAAFVGSESLLDAFSAEVPDRPTGEVRTLLAKYGLTAEHVLRAADTLSPGERTRAGLALLQARGVNVLVLDEPTNHLDLPAIEQLEQALAGYRGTLLLVTHDRRMLAAVDTTRRLAVAGGQVTEG